MISCYMISSYSVLMYLIFTFYPFKSSSYFKLIRITWGEYFGPLASSKVFPSFHRMLNPVVHNVMMFLHLHRIFRCEQMFMMLGIFSADINFYLWAWLQSSLNLYTAQSIAATFLCWPQHSVSTKSCWKSRHMCSLSCNSSDLQFLWPAILVALSWKDVSWFAITFFTFHWFCLTPGD